MDETDKRMDVSASDRNELATGHFNLTDLATPHVVNTAIALTIMNARNRELSGFRFQTAAAIAAIGIASSAAGQQAASPSEIQLGSLSPTSAKQGWGELKHDQSVSGSPLTIAGRQYDHGLGTHASGEIAYDLLGDYDTFKVWVGVDDFLKNHPEAPKASVVFQVFADGVKVFDSGVMKIGDKAKLAEVEISGVSELKLVSTDAGDGISCDHADWAEPTLTGGDSLVREAKAEHTVKASGIAVGLSKAGRIVSARIGDTEWSVSGDTLLGGFRMQGEPSTAIPEAGVVAILRNLTDGKGHTCAVTDRFSPDRDSIRWDVELTSPDAPWSAPIVSRLKCAKPEERLLWTSWGSPDFSGTRLTPELAALVQAGKASVGGAWSDPLVPTGFLNRSWHYGNVAQNCPVGSDYVSLPLCTLLAPANDTGLSLVLSPADVLLNMDLTVSANGQLQFARANHRLGGGKTVRFTLQLVPHEASWRGGLRFMTARYPEYFEAPNPRAHKLAACGAYTLCEAPIDVAKFKKMAFGFNWKLSDDFPYMGMFIPPVKDMDEKWTRSCGEPAPKGQGSETSCRQMNNYAKTMKESGFSVLSYFNVTEFGKEMNRGGQRPVKLSADAPDLWKDPAAFVKYRIPNAVFDPGIQTCYLAYITDPADPDYMKHILEQTERNTRMLPDTDGICIDRADWLRLYNPKADDGVSWLNGKPARSLFRSWAELMAQMGPQMHKADKVIFSNMMTMRLELCKELDGIYTEFGNNGNALSGSALLCLRKPVVAWSYNETLHQPNPDAFMQRHLHLGAFPTAPYPNNNHCINPEPAADQLYLDYGPLLDAMRGKKWVLAPHCVESATAKVNLFEVPGGYAMPVTFGGNAVTATVTVRNIPGLDHLKAVVLHPGDPVEKPLQTVLDDDRLTLDVPLIRGCSMVRLVPKR